MTKIFWLLLGLSLTAPFAPARAQAPAAIAAALIKPASPVAAAPATPPVLTPAQAQGVLDILQNDAKRAQFVAVLQNMAKVQAAVAPKPAPAAIALAPGSLGAELLQGTSSAIEHASTSLIHTVRALFDVGALRNWFLTAASDPQNRALIVDVLWKSLVLGSCGAAVEYLLRRALRPWRLRLAGVEVHEEAADAVPRDEADAPGKPSAWTMLRRIPYALLRLLIEIAPRAAFAFVVYALLTTPLGVNHDSRLILLALADAAISAGVAMAVARTLLSPDAGALRMVHMSDASAQYLTRWAQRFAYVGFFGYAIDQAGLLFGMAGGVHDALLKAVALVLHIFALIVVLGCRARVSRRLRAPEGRRGFIAFIRNRLAATWHLWAIFYIVGFWLIVALEVPHEYAVMGHYAGIAALVVIGARLTSIVLLGAVDRALRPRAEPQERYAGIVLRAERYHPLLRRLIRGLIAIVAVILLLQWWGVPVLRWFERGGLGGRIIDSLLLSLLTIALAIVLWEGINIAIERHLARLVEDGHLARSARLRTLLPMLRTTLMGTIFVFAALTVLSQIGVNTAPLLAGAGVIGIAIGFGSQKLVQDVITGLFLLLENTVQVGDTVSLASLTGTVETLSIRTIRLRALDGAVHVIPFSAVTTVTNSSRDYGYALIDVTAGYNEEPDMIAGVLREVAVEIRLDEVWKDRIEDDLEVLGVDKFLDNAWVLRARIKTRPENRLGVQREFNRRLKYRFDLQAIESPFTSPRILSTNPPPPPEIAPPPEPAA